MLSYNMLLPPACLLVTYLMHRFHANAHLYFLVAEEYFILCVHDNLFSQFPLVDVWVVLKILLL